MENKSKPKVLRIAAADGEWLADPSGGFIFAFIPSNMSEKEKLLLDEAFDQALDLPSLINQRVRKEDGEVKDHLYICDSKTMVKAMNAVPGIIRVSQNPVNYLQDATVAEITLKFFLRMLKPLQGSIDTIKTLLINSMLSVQQSARNTTKSSGILVIIVSVLSSAKLIKLNYINASDNTRFFVVTSNCLSPIKYHQRISYIDTGSFYRPSKGFLDPEKLPKGEAQQVLTVNAVEGKWLIDPSGGLVFAFLEAAKSQKQKNLLSQTFDESLSLLSSIITKALANGAEVKEYVFICDPQTTYKTLNSINGMSQTSVKDETHSFQGTPSSIIFDFFKSILKSIKGDFEEIKDFLLHTAIMKQDVIKQTKKTVGILFMLPSVMLSSKFVNISYLVPSKKTIEWIRAADCSQADIGKVDISFNNVSFTYRTPKNQAIVNTSQ